MERRALSTLEKEWEELEWDAWRWESGWEERGEGSCCTLSRGDVWYCPNDG